MTSALEEVRIVMTVPLWRFCVENHLACLTRTVSVLILEMFLWCIILN